MTTTHVPQDPAIHRVLAIPELFELILQDFNYKKLFGVLRVNRRFHHLILNTPQLCRTMYLEKNVSDTPKAWRIQLLNPILNNSFGFLRLTPNERLRFRSSCIHAAPESSVFNVMCDFYSTVMDGSLVGGSPARSLPSWSKMRLASTNVTIAITTILGFDQRQDLTLTGANTLGDVMIWLMKQKRHTDEKFMRYSASRAVSSSVPSNRPPQEVAAQQEMGRQDTTGQGLVQQGTVPQDYANVQTPDYSVSTLKALNRKKAQLESRLRSVTPNAGNVRWFATLQYVSAMIARMEAPKPSQVKNAEPVSSSAVSGFFDERELSTASEPEWTDWEQEYILDEPSDLTMSDNFD